jgi:serine/threonine protein phosphatase PrpC
MTTIDRAAGVAIGLASRPGTVHPSGDAAVVHTTADQATAVAVVDGIGHSDRVAYVARLLAEVAARVAARRGPLAGLLSAGELVADPGDGEEPEPDAVAVVAVTQPGKDTTRVAWVGDCRAWGWDGAELRQYSTDHTMGQWLRIHRGVPADIVSHHDAWVRVTVAGAVVATVREVEIPDRLVLLTSDGVHDQVDLVDLVDLVRAHVADPQALAQALTAAARTSDGGERDDATAVVLLIS